MTEPIIHGLEPATRRQLAIDLFNHVWTLLETPARTTQQNDEMLHAAHASRYHWGEVGTPAHLARGEWLCSRVYSVLERAEPATHHARRCLEVCETSALVDWDLAAAWEAVCRAALIRHDDAAANEALLSGRAALDGIGDDEDRRLVATDLEGLAERLRPRS